jgi:hypothetical protein
MAGITIQAILPSIAPRVLDSLKAGIRLFFGDLPRLFVRNDDRDS